MLWLVKYRGCLVAMFAVASVSAIDGDVLL